MSLRFKLALIASLLTLAGLGLGLGITYWSLVQIRINELNRELRLLAEVIYDATLFREGDVVRVPEVVESYLTDESGARAGQIYYHGQLLWERGALQAPRPLDPAGLRGETGGHTVANWQVFTYTEEDEGIVVQVGRPLLGTWEVLGAYTRVAVPIAAILTLIASIIAWQTVGLALRPLRELTQATSRFGETSEVPVVPG